MASDQVRCCRRVTPSRLSTPKKHSAAALSAELPTPLMLQIRPIGVAMETGQKDVFIIDLKFSKRINASHRAQGISSLDVYQSPNGVVALKAGWLLKKFPIADTIKHLYETLRWLGNARLLT